MLITHLFAKTVGKKEWIHAALRAVPRTLKLGDVIATAARDSPDSNSGCALALGAGGGERETPPHTPLLSSLVSEGGS